ncbi:hypothetical protein [Undibacterium terreum]|uniref:Uncharacterized protein n=1 Tax=Undibacterium terreum TaxID=1224302 RepID=A0A916UEY4_9BURK|nr:hypothetical protein [Undibacterium terreum]GGC69891.1 hypothetical protein GCM10011396_16150 [Undibacterium terreum]
MHNKNRLGSYQHVVHHCSRLLLSIAFSFQLYGVVQAAPLLRCEVIYAGVTYTVVATPGSDPYSIEAVDIGERFRFKAVMVSVDKPIDYIKLYAYFQTRRKDIPIHQATYLPPFTVSDKPYPLTPQNYLYAGDVERELQYHCTLQGVAP